MPKNKTAWTGEIFTLNTQGDPAPNGELETKNFEKLIDLSGENKKELDIHSANTEKHISEQERISWNKNTSDIISIFELIAGGGSGSGSIKKSTQVIPYADIPAQTTHFVRLDPPNGYTVTQDSVVSFSLRNYNMYDNVSICISIQSDNTVYMRVRNVSGNLTPFNPGTVNLAWM